MAVLPRSTCRTAHLNIKTVNFKLSFCNLRLDHNFVTNIGHLDCNQEMFLLTLVIEAFVFVMNFYLQIDILQSACTSCYSFETGNYLRWTLIQVFWNIRQYKS